RRRCSEEEDASVRLRSCGFRGASDHDFCHRRRHLPWLNYSPRRYDLRRLVGGTRTLPELTLERECRARILATSDSPHYQRLGELLRHSDDGSPLPLGHCPINAHQFQVWGVSRVLSALADFDDVRMITVSDRCEECKPSELRAIRWAR